MDDRSRVLLVVLGVVFVVLTFVNTDDSVVRESSVSSLAGSIDVVSLPAIKQQVVLIITK